MSPQKRMKLILLSKGLSFLVSQQGNLFIKIRQTEKIISPYPQYTSNSSWQFRRKTESNISELSRYIIILIPRE